MTKRGTIRNTGLVARERAGRNRTLDGWAVYHVKKNGELYAKPNDTFRTETEAREKAA